MIVVAVVVVGFHRVVDIGVGLVRIGAIVDANIVIDVSVGGGVVLVLLLMLLWLWLWRL